MLHPPAARNFAGVDRSILGPHRAAFPDFDDAVRPEVLDYLEKTRRSIAATIFGPIIDSGTTDIGYCPSFGIIRTSDFGSGPIIGIAWTVEGDGSSIRNLLQQHC